MRTRILVLLGIVTLALMSPITASAQYYFPPVTIEYPGACYGITYNPSDLGAIRPDSAWDLANIGGGYHRCIIGDALWRAGVLPAAPYGYYWTGDYALAPEPYPY
jgi:hypothetical protein